MLQMFHLDVSKVDLGVAHVAMAIHACFKCFIYLRRILQTFNLDVFKSRYGVAHAAIAIHACFKHFIYFRHMLQVFHLDVSKIDIGEAHVLLLVRCRGSPCCHGSPHTPAGATIVACMRAREIEHTQGGPHA